jgi:CDP-glucose 4,6-dehydratase
MERCYEMSKFNVFNSKTVLITGNSGFKGSWLSAWLVQLGAKVVGFSLDVPSTPSHFAALRLEDKIVQVWGDIRNLDACAAVVDQYRPDFVFHLAAQPLVRRSYLEPHDTFITNTGGTLNMLEALRVSNHPCAAVFITSDKCYDNVEQLWGYRENDRLGGQDPYSGSKGAAELIIRSYAASFFNGDSAVRVAVGRAGNVIGGGDWAEDRIIPDAVRAWSNNESLQIRNPNATRPWQHVLEPLAGYLALAADLVADEALRGEAFNFGPPADQNYSVSELLEQMQLHWADAVWRDVSESGAVYESGLLKLCCDKALHRIAWKPLLTFAENVEMTANWYSSYYDGNADIWKLTESQILQYEALGVDRGAVWAK